MSDFRCSIRHFLVSPVHFRVHWAQLSCKRLQPTHAQQVVGAADQVRLQLHARDAACKSFAQSPIGLHPAEDLLDAFAFSLTYGVDGPARNPGRDAKSRDW